MNWGLILGVMSSILIFSYLWILWDIILNDWEKVDIDLDIEELEGDSDILLSNCSPLGKKNIDTRIITKKIAINLRSIESFK